MTKLVCLSDIHSHEIDLPEGSILVLAGDLLNWGTDKEFFRFKNWLEKESVKFQDVVLTYGNHDLFIDQNFQLCKEELRPLAHLLADEGITLQGIKFWASPVVPWINGHFAAEKQRGREIANHWRQVPKDTNVLITHTMPAHLMGSRYGCEDLLYEVTSRIRPQYCISGHEHSASNRCQLYKGTWFWNVALCNERYEPVNPVVVIDYEA